MSAICLICKKKEVVTAFKPFCSKRCADIDLGRWFNGGYGIPTDEAAPDPGRAGEVLDFPKGNSEG